MVMLRVRVRVRVRVSTPPPLTPRHATHPRRYYLPLTTYHLLISQVRHRRPGRGLPPAGRWRLAVRLVTHARWRRHGTLGAALHCGDTGSQQLTFRSQPHQHFTLGVYGFMGPSPVAPPPLESDTNCLGPRVLLVITVMVGLGVIGSREGPGSDCLDLHYAKPKGEPVSEERVHGFVRASSVASLTLKKPREAPRSSPLPSHRLRRLPYGFRCLFDRLLSRLAAFHRILECHLLSEQEIMCE
eukprot:scaffold25797_cov55-Phaeocystis_antarctica.AAC.3